MSKKGDTMLRNLGKKLDKVHGSTSMKKCDCSHEKL